MGMVLPKVSFSLGAGAGFIGMMASLSTRFQTLWDGSLRR